MLANFLKTLGFKLCYFDRHVCMRIKDTNAGFDYIFAHVDDFKVVAKDPSCELI